MKECPCSNDLVDFSHICQVCNQYFCVICEKMHKDPKLKCEHDPDIRKCRHCRVMYIKVDGCNHIACPCGAHNCFKCGASFNSREKCYAHLTKEHGGWYWCSSRVSPYKLIMILYTLCYTILDLHIYLIIYVWRLTLRNKFNYEQHNVDLW